MSKTLTQSGLAAVAFPVGLLNDMWSFSTLTKEWTWYCAVALLAHACFQASWHYCSECAWELGNKKCRGLSASAVAGVLTDVRQSSTNSPGGRFNAAIVFEASSNAVWLFGGCKRMRLQLALTCVDVV